LEYEFNSIEKKIEQESEITEAQLTRFRGYFKRTIQEDDDQPSSGYFEEYQTSRNLIFEHDSRPGSYDKSLFEQILSTKGTSMLIELIWDEFELWRKEKVLITVRHAIEEGQEQSFIIFPTGKL
jgi:hypothetical protein